MSAAVTGEALAVTLLFCGLSAILLAAGLTDLAALALAGAPLALLSLSLGGSRDR